MLPLEHRHPHAALSEDDRGCEARQTAADDDGAGGLGWCLQLPTERRQGDRPGVSGKRWIHPDILSQRSEAGGRIPRFFRDLPLEASQLSPKNVNNLFFW